jgi:GNAT superfamily N-acetyltransferase
VALVAYREINFPAGYDGTITTDGDQRLFIVANDCRAIAMVISHIDEDYWRLAFDPDGRARRLDSNLHQGKRQTIARVWVAKNYRDSGIGSSLVKTVIKTLGHELSDIGWELPLTKDGTKLIRRLTPSQWWGRGDTIALDKTLYSEN